MFVAYRDSMCCYDERVSSFVSSDGREALQGQKALFSLYWGGRGHGVHCMQRRILLLLRRCEDDHVDIMSEVTS